ncbi:hypothetical protein BGW38_010028 [Lunasporangiospora selenospora]|uniref:Uncharacterized protein n=1 Tax=Lunasporangiospora selenospora TaxID=979761 RepID=A0A9P6EXS4_9FUNG|nr:hypothetical protein BGW38_010028 [Lunasporangiospora selenospora]
MWAKMRGWILELFPTLELSQIPHHEIFGWPLTAGLPTIAIHLHSTVTHAIWRTYCKLGDGEHLMRDELLWMSVNGFKKRAQTELARAHYLDKQRREKARSINEKRKVEKNPTPAYTAFENVWNTPPRITVTREAVFFGEMWPTPGDASTQAAAGA